MIEKSIERSIVRLLKKYGIEVPKLQAPGRRGFPDRTMLMPGGKPIFLEIKTAKGVIAPTQKVWHELLRSLNYEVHVVRSKEDVTLILEAHGVPHPKATK